MQDVIPSRVFRDTLLSHGSKRTNRPKNAFDSKPNISVFPTSDIN